HTRFSRDWSSDVCSSDLPRERLPSPDHIALVDTSSPNDTVSTAAQHGPRKNQPTRKPWPGGRCEAPLEGRVQYAPASRQQTGQRSEERRVGKEWRARRAP